MGNFSDICHVRRDLATRYKVDRRDLRRVDVRASVKKQQKSWR